MFYVDNIHYMLYTYSVKKIGYTKNTIERGAGQNGKTGNEQTKK